MQGVKAEVPLRVGDVVEETGAIYAGKLPIKKGDLRKIKKMGSRKMKRKGSRRRGVFVVLPPDGEFVCKFNDLACVAKEHNSGVTNYKRWNKGDGGTLGPQIPFVQIPSTEEMEVILKNSNKGELGRIFNQHGFNSGSFPQGYLWINKPGEVKGESQKIEGNKTMIPTSHTIYQVRPFDGDLYDNPKYVSASGFLTFTEQVGNKPSLLKM